MTDLSLPDVTLLDPTVDLSDVREVARDTVVIGNRGIALVPNVGIIGGNDSILVVETGMGIANGETVLKFAEEYARGRRVYLTTTHFHPEHAFGVQTFAGEATDLVNQAQATDRKTKGPGYIGMFTGLGPQIARHLQGVELFEPDVVYDKTFELDLGGRVVELQATGRGHTRGDQVVKVSDTGVLLTGDLAEAGQFVIFLWFPPYDTDVSGTRWLAVMERL